MTRAITLCLLFCVAASAALAAKVEVKYTDAQKNAIDAIEKQGGLVLRVAQDSDAHRVDYHLQGKGLTDAGLQHLKNVPNLVDLNVAGTKITDAGVKTIAQIATLERLNMNNTAVTDAGLASVKNLKNLTYLNLYGCEGVTNNGLAHVGGLAKLKALYIWKTKIDKDAAKKFSDARKSVRVNSGWDLSPVIAKPIAVTPNTTKVVAKHVNSKCPITGKAVNPSKTFTYKGEVIALCCDNCLGKFSKNPQTYISKVVRDIKPAAAKLTIKQIMVKAHKGKMSLSAKASQGKASKAELGQLLEFYQIMATLKPKKGDAASWTQKTKALVDSAQGLVAGKKPALAAFKGAVNCKACHDVHK